MRGVVKPSVAVVGPSSTASCAQGRWLPCHPWLGRSPCYVAVAHKARMIMRRKLTNILNTVNLIVLRVFHMAQI